MQPTTRRPRRLVMSCSGRGIDLRDSVSSGRPSVGWVSGSEAGSEESSTGNTGGGMASRDGILSKGTSLSGKWVISGSLFSPQVGLISVPGREAEGEFKLPSSSVAVVEDESKVNFAAGVPENSRRASCT